MIPERDLPQTLAEYAKLEEHIDALQKKDREEWRRWVRAYADSDLYFFLRYCTSAGKWTDQVAKQRACDNEWVLRRTKETQAGWDGFLDIWSRGHWKSTIKSFALVMWILLQDPERCILLVSIEKSLATDHTGKVRTEFEANQLFREIWPTSVWQTKSGKPRKGTVVWSADEMTLPRQGNRLEASLEASGIIENLPTGKHFDDIFFDDLVRETSTRSPLMRKKLLEQWQSMTNLTSRGYRMTGQGTRYHHGDLHVVLPEMGFAVRERPGVDRSQVMAGEVQVKRDNGVKTTVNLKALGGTPLYLTVLELAKRWVEQGPLSFGRQILCDAMAGMASVLPHGNLRYFTREPQREKIGKNVYILGDLGGSRVLGGEFQVTGEDHDPTAFLVIGLGADRNYYALDIVQDWLSPAKRIEVLFALHRRWGPRIAETRLEATLGAEHLDHHMKEKMEEFGYRFRITWVSADRASGKEDKIYSFWQPILDESKLYIPQLCQRPDKDGKLVNLALLLAKQVEDFPIGSDHLLDCFCLLAERKDKDGKAITRPLIWPSAAPWLQALDEAEYRSRHRDRDPELPSSDRWMAHL